MYTYVPKVLGLSVYLTLLQGVFFLLNGQKIPSSVTENLVQRIIIAGDTIHIDELNEKQPLLVCSNQAIEFDFSTLSGRATTYRYYLKGFEAKLSKRSYKNSAYYYNLASGDYVFYLQSGNRHQEISFVVSANYNRYITSSLILIVVVAVFLLILKFKIIKTVTSKVGNQHGDSIAPLFSKYLKTEEKPNSVSTKKLLHKSAVRYDKATVLFADIQGFTKIVEQLNPEALIDQLDKFFIFFDEITEKFKIEKIKTIGDAYMCAGGLPERNSTNPIEVVLAALEMQKYMQYSRDIARENNSEFWELRIGIHTGPVISGVIGRNKLSFDIWGDTVNIASRMESSSEAGKINVSGITYQLIKDFFVCEYRGKMPIKYKGETDMYFVKGIAPHLSVNNDGDSPNDLFKDKLQWIRYNDLEDMVLSQLTNELPSIFKYHNVKHTIEVCTQVEVIGRGEGLNNRELLLVKTSALFHDVGYMINPEKHEVQSVRFAREILPKYEFTKSEVEAISQLIMATETNAQPQMLMERIMNDANLDYLGRADFISLSETLWEEVCNFKGKLSHKDWNKKQYEFVSNHVYYTNTAKKLRQVNKETQLKKLKELLG